MMKHAQPQNMCVERSEFTVVSSPVLIGERGKIPRGFRTVDSRYLTRHRPNALAKRICKVLDLVPDIAHLSLAISEIRNSGEIASWGNKSGTIDHVRPVVKDR